MKPSWFFFCNFNRRFCPSPLLQKVSAVFMYLSYPMSWLQFLFSPHYLSIVNEINWSISLFLRIVQQYWHLFPTMNWKQRPLMEIRQCKNEKQKIDTKLWKFTKCFNLRAMARKLTRQVCSMRTIMVANEILTDWSLREDERIFLSFGFLLV